MLTGGRETTQCCATPDSVSVERLSSGQEFALLPVDPLLDPSSDSPTTQWEAFSSLLAQGMPESNHIEEVTAVLVTENVRKRRNKHEMYK